MTIRDFDPRAPHPVTTVLKRLAGPFKVARKGGDVFVRRVPPTVNAAQAGTTTFAARLRNTSDSKLRRLVSGSIGLGTGLYGSGKRRLVVAARVAPAIVGRATIAMRRDDGSIELGHAAGARTDLPIAGI